MSKESWLEQAQQAIKVVVLLVHNPGCDELEVQKLVPHSRPKSRSVRARLRHLFREPIQQQRIGESAVETAQRLIGHYSGVASKQLAFLPGPTERAEEKRYVVVYAKSGGVTTPAMRLVQASPTERHIALSLFNNQVTKN